jgi:concanavalin A-like lectin/glucanase superfamily protein
VTFATGKVGQAFSFDGIDDYVHVPDAPSLNPSTISIEAWVYVTGNPGGFTMHIVDKDDVASERQYILEVGPDFSFFESHVWTSSGQHFVIGASSVQLFTWYHVATTYDGHVLTLYVNGRLDGSMPADGPLVITSVPVIIGMSGGTPTSNFQGLIDEPRIYNRALSATEIQAIFNAGSAGKCKGVPFKAFSADITIKLESEPNQQTFKLISKFVPGPESDGIDPANETVSFQIGVLSISLPAGSFRSVGGNFSFDGVIAGVRLQVKIIQQNGRGWRLVAKGGHANLSGTQIPVKVGLLIGDDNGSVTLKNTLLMAGSHPLRLESDDKGIP